MRKVVLKPCELHIACVDGLTCLYAGLWDITSSDAQTHDSFCNIASYYKVFNFYNTGRYADESRVYTFDDGRNSLMWLSGLYRIIKHCKKNCNIDVVVELNKDFNKQYGVSSCFNKAFSAKVQDKLIDTYLKIINDAFDGHTITRCKGFSPYTYKLLCDKIFVNIEDLGDNK